MKQMYVPLLHMSIITDHIQRTCD